MEIDLAQLDSSATGISFAHICIIGGGIAGLTLAHKLVTLGHEILLLEAGGQTPEAFDADRAGRPSSPRHIRAPASRPRRNIAHLGRPASAISARQHRMAHLSR